MTQPPQNLDAEREILGTLLLHYTPQAIHIIQATGLVREDFYRRQHEIIYRAILQLHARGSHVDHLTVARFLEGQRDENKTTFLHHAGGKSGLELLTMYAVAHGLKERAMIVHEDGRWRRWLNALYEAQEHVHDRDGEAFWAAIESIRPDVLPEAVEGQPGPLRVIDGEKAA